MAKRNKHPQKKKNWQYGTAGIVPVFVPVIGGIVFLGVFIFFLVCVPIRRRSCSARNGIVLLAGTGAASHDEPKNHLYTGGIYLSGYAAYLPHLFLFPDQKDTSRQERDHSCGTPHHSH